MLDITLKDKSVLSKKTLEQVEANPKRKWKGNGDEKTNAEEHTDGVADRLKKGEKTSMPESVSPMLCTLIEKAFNDTNWIY